MASLQAIADGLVVRLAGIEGMRALAWRRDSLVPPCCEVAFPERIAYDQTLGTLGDRKTRWTIPVLYYAARADAALAQRWLAAAFDDAGPLSLKAAIEGDDTLGGAAEACEVAEADAFGVYAVNGVDYLGCRLVVHVWTG